MCFFLQQIWEKSLSACSLNCCLNCTLLLLLTNSIRLVPVSERAALFFLDKEGGICSEIWHRAVLSPVQTVQKAKYKGVGLKWWIYKSFSRRSEIIKAIQLSWWANTMSHVRKPWTSRTEFISTADLVLDAGNKGQVQNYFSYSWCLFFWGLVQTFLARSKVLALSYLASVIWKLDG